VELVLERGAPTGIAANEAAGIEWRRLSGCRATTEEPPNMAEKKPSRKTSAPAFTPEERAAMKERAREQKATKGRAAGEADLLAKVAEMPKADRTIAERIHAIVQTAAPDLLPKTWYGMPAYANADGKVVCFFQSGAKFKTRYATLGFNESANLDNGVMWPTAFALVGLTPAEEKKIAALVKKAVR
jgi:uncharacterized protein YdhG (YjbR/CyaY superfamily)